MSNTVEELNKALLEYDADGAERLARRAIEEGLDPMVLLHEITETSRQVGDAYGRGELWLPDLVGMAEAMRRALPVLEEKILASGKKMESRGTIVAGTVVGDIHSIGIGMVVALARAAGFKVIDLGVDVSPEKFLQALREHKPDILAMSALLTTTAQAQKAVIETLKEENLRDRVKVAVGGGAITQEFADMIGADGYRPTAPGAVELFKTLAGRG
jgi:methanogenic corrinoid protein MtbC1